jgi:hypothetical protein
LSWARSARSQIYPTFTLTDDTRLEARRPPCPVAFVKNGINGLGYESRFTAEAPRTAEVTQSGGGKLNLCVSSAPFGSSVVNLHSQRIPKGEISDETGFNVSFDSSNDYLRRRVGS